MSLRDFLYDTIGKTFYNTKFLEKRANDSMSRERSLLPSTQIYVKRELEKRNLIKESKQKQAVVLVSMQWDQASDI